MPDYASKRRALIALVEARALSRGRPVVLASGRRSNIYFNLKPVIMDPSGAALIAHLLDMKLAALDDPPPDYMGGMEIGAIPLTTALGVLRQLEEKPAPRGFFIRKSAKAHGTQKRIEGLAQGETLKGGRALILEDVSTTGGSALAAAQIVREAGASVAHVLTVIDRQEGAQETLAGAGLALSAILAQSDFS